MFDDFEAYFHENVWDGYRNYSKVKKSLKAGKSNDLNTALIAASAIFHLREHLPREKSQSYASIVQRCPDYELLGNVVNASKHHILTQRKNALINGAKDLSEAFISTTYKDELGEYQHVEKSVFIKLKDGTERDLFEVITNVMNMWLSFLHGLGLIKFIKQIDIHDQELPRRTKHSGKLNLTVIQGLRMKHEFRLQRYNYETCKIEPVDLTNSKPVFTIYEHTYSVALIIENKQTEQEQKVEIQVDEKQKKKLLSLPDKEKLEYFLRLAIEQGVVEAKQNDLTE